VWADVDNVCDVEKNEARKMLVNRAGAASNTSAAPRKSGSHFSRFVVPPLELTSSFHYFINIIIRKAYQFTNLLYKHLFGNVESAIAFCKRHHIY